MQNLEFKAKCHSFVALRQRLATLKAEHHQTMEQVDTYFNVPKGRLKLREIDSGEVPLCEDSAKRNMLVYYERSDIAESRYSHYQLCEIPNPVAFKQMMSAALGVKVVVEKRRELWTFGNTRIHLDCVVNLGEFVELETVIKDQTEAEARAEHQLVKNTLEIKEEDLISVSYSDLLCEPRVSRRKRKTS